MYFYVYFNNLFDSNIHIQTDKLYVLWLYFNDVLLFTDILLFHLDKFVLTFSKIKSYT